MLAWLVSIQGITTIVAQSAGIPAEKSIRGKGRGVRKRVVASLSRSLINWLTATISGTAKGSVSSPFPVAQWRAGFRPLRPSLTD